MVKMSGGEALARCLVEEGVEVVFGVPGIQIYGIVAALRDEPGIRMVTTRHEQATTYMADGYARASGKPGVALVVPGVGLFNAASGLATAYARSSPVLCLAGQIPRHQLGKNLGAVHEVSDQLDVIRPVTKWRQQALRPRDVPDTVAEAFRQMRTGRPRPAAIEIPRMPWWSGKKSNCGSHSGLPGSCPVRTPSGGRPRHCAVPPAPHIRRRRRGKVGRGSGSRPTGRGHQHTSHNVNRRQGDHPR